MGPRQAKALVGGGCKVLDQAGARYGLPPYSGLLLCFLPSGLRNQHVTSLSCPDQGQETGSSHSCSNTTLSGCIGKIGWLDLLHLVWKGGNWSITGLRRVQGGASRVRSGDQVALSTGRSLPCEKFPRRQVRP